ncbi:Uma2 family endonuclease [Nostoc muscorum FACHB-395]|nr:Uma2 family endonuclease [Desmonostoc muscorum FACHB-395]
MFAVVTPDTIHLPPGAVVRLPGSWQDYQALNKQLGDRSSPRIKYRDGEILLMAPLPEHGRKVSVIADVVKVLLDHLGREYEAFTPITMELPQESGIEPDYCFYIENWEAITGKDRINWGVDPSPYLVVEIDITSYTDVNDYLPYRVPDVWLFRKNQLVIYTLQGDVYQQAASLRDAPRTRLRYTVESSSRYFSNINVSEVVTECLKIAYDRNTSAAIRELRRKLANES